MNNEFFPPTEAELDDMIKDIQKKMETAEDRAEYDKLHDKLKELRQQKQQLIIQNNALWQKKSLKPPKTSAKSPKR